MKIKKLLLLMPLLLLGEVASAAITTGYYRVKSYNSKYLTENTSSHALVCSDLASPTSYAQVWYLTVSGSNVTMKNALTDRWIQKTTGSDWSEQYVTGTSSNTFTLNDEGSGIITFTDKWSAGPHCDNSLNVVLWVTEEAKSKWTVEAVTVDADELAAQKAATAEATTSQLTTFFTSTACTALKSTYTGYSDANLRSAMSALPTTVQEMAVKVKNNSWVTYSGWDKTEKTFRIADYKAYSSGDRWTTILGCSHHLGRLSNPTGIWVDANSPLQVYVGAIPSGESVKLEVAGYGQASGTTYDLHQGMNSLLMATAGNCFIFYEVDNTTSGAAPYKLLSDYADVTVHIEGGSVQGYFDLTKGDDDDDWAQLKSNLLKAGENVCLKTDKHVMNLEISRLNTALGSSSMVDMLNVWRDCAEWEDELMGRTDAASGQSTYGQYCNNIFSVTMTSSGYAHATTYGTCYPPAYDAGIYNATKLKTVADNMWCIAHEQGHNRQKPINMVGNTEVSNNLFSNVNIYKLGRFTSRTANIQDVFTDYINGVSWPERVKRACDGVGNYNQQLLHLNWQLYLFFHVNGNDPDFFPRLFDALRKDPMTSTAGASNKTSAQTDYLKYYTKCCEVSGYDLTDFFAAYGFFMLPPKQSTALSGTSYYNYQSFNDYSDYNLYVTSSLITSAKKKVANMSGLKKCNIIFIEDRVKAPDATYEGHASGAKKTINPDSPVKAFGDVGDLGQYTDFGAECSAYAFNISPSGYVTMSGTGAVGFIVYDDSDNIVGFYNTNTFRLPSAAYDETGLKSGYVIKAAAGNGEVAETTLDPTIAINMPAFSNPNYWYTFKCTTRGNRLVTSGGAGAGVKGATSTVDAAKWKLVLRDGSLTEFDIINKKDGSYLNPVCDYDTQITTTTTQPAAGWKLTSAGSGKYIIVSGSTQLNQTNTSPYAIYSYGGGANTTDDGCLFTVTPVGYEVQLNEVGDASYATFYLDRDAKTDASTTKAYYAQSQSGGSVIMTETASSGRNIPKNTAVMLVSSKKSTKVTFTFPTTSLTTVVSEDANLLKGTLNGMFLDLSASSPYYALGSNGAIGFFKFKDETTNATTIALGANKAYLEVSGGAAKGISLIFGDETTGVEEVSGVKVQDSSDAPVFDLSGRRVNKATKGLYIQNGKKIIK
ncbi:MAG: M60 family metallopeptidase [Bacteroidaceae bacterium]|nr:M60 family metallopeptidase [Bacteroidaceae bacterium]